ncbi:hypothetical protein KZX70_15305 [Paenibacillus silvae]|uniref:hypothetical protein n=1 Tax=Paenibacillus silvae TaxID=1325358 RepID=UPI0020065722|nr:hypothetical protein [Paenibacillus silvae]MCK6076222.1 hypothetical protein [Paenibacillus silvae]
MKMIETLRFSDPDMHVFAVLVKFDVIYTKIVLSAWPAARIILKQYAGIRMSRVEQGNE